MNHDYILGNFNLNKILNFGNPFFKTLKDKTIGNLLDKINISDEQVFKTIR